MSSPRQPRRWHGSVVSSTARVSVALAAAALAAGGVTAIGAPAMAGPAAPVIPENAARHAVPGAADLAETDGVAMISSDDVWAVGSRGTAATAEHWDGTTWTTVRVPVPEGQSKSYLVTVAGSSSDDVWAAGDSSDAGGVLTPLLEHWNGKRWSIVDCPTTPGANTRINGIDVLSADDAWLVGNTGNLLSLTIHWNGTKWKIVKSPNVEGMQVDQLNQVVGTSPDDLWAVGYSAILSKQYSTMAMHWNGKAWKLVKTPDLKSVNFDLQAATYVGSDDVWATGSVYEGSGFESLAEHWNGHRWRRVSMPSDPDGVSSYPLAISATSAKDIWAAGWFATAAGNEVPLMERWDGTAWKLVDTPVIQGTPYYDFFSVSALTRKDAWAVGGYYVGSQWASLFEHWNGHAWRVIKRRG